MATAACLATFCRAFRRDRNGVRQQSLDAHLPAKNSAASFTTFVPSPVITACMRSTNYCTVKNTHTHKKIDMRLSLTATGQSSAASKYYFWKPSIEFQRVRSVAAAENNKTLVQSQSKISHVFPNHQGSPVTAQRNILIGFSLSDV